MMRAVDPLLQLIGDSPVMVSLREQIRHILKRAGVGRRAAPILILGETGTGKSLIARTVHQVGPRASGPLVEVNCAAIPEHLLEAELFGHERGAFTDARRSKPGLFQLAHRGVLFLDEISLLTGALQAKLLTVLDDGVVRRLGATAPETVDVWVIAATNEDVDAARQAHRFREDLYHRLAVLAIDVPSLRARGDDILNLAEHFLARACTDYGLSPRTLTPDAAAALLAYRWPGNVRELSNVLERAVLLSEAPVITAATLALPVAPPDVGDRPLALEAASTGSRSSRDRMCAHLLEVLSETGWNITRTAAVLGVSRNTVTARIARFGLVRSDRAGPARAAPAPSGRDAPASAGKRSTQPVIDAPGMGATPDSAATTIRHDGNSGPGDDGTTVVPDEMRPLSEDLHVSRSRWERRHVALFRADLEVDTNRGEPSDPRGVIDLIIARVQSFGGRVEELGLTTVVAAFGVEPTEDASSRASLAALAVRKDWEREQTAPDVGGRDGRRARLPDHDPPGREHRPPRCGRQAGGAGEFAALIRRGERGTILVSRGGRPLA